MLTLSLATGEDVTPNDRSYWIVPRRFLAGAYPGSRHSPREKLQAIVDAGVHRFVNLTEVGEVNANNGLELQPYDGLLERHDLHFHRFPIRDNYPPSNAALMDHILDTIDAGLKANQGVYLHCLGGMGRTGSVAACWLLRHGLATRETWSDVLHHLRQADRTTGTLRVPEYQRQTDWINSYAEKQAALR